MENSLRFFYCKNFKRRREKMRFRNDIHKRRFEKEIKKMDKKDNTQMAIVFLLTANLALWNRCKIQNSLTYWKTPFCDFVPSAVKHLCVKVKEVEENIAEVPSVINAVWRKTFRITAKRRKSPHYRQRARRQNKENRHRTRKTLYRCLFFFSKLRKY